MSGKNSPFAPVERPQKTAFVVARALADHISGLEAGEALPPERQLIEEFAVGRSTMREALRILELQGLVDIRTGRNGGPIVKEPDPAALGQSLSLLLASSAITFREVLSARGAIEAALARLAAENRTEDDIEVIEGSIDTMAAHLDDEAVFLVENTKFHSAIAVASRNSVLAMFLASLRTVYDGHAIGVTYSKRRMSHIQDYHQRIAKAIVEGYPSEAESAMDLHMSEFRAYMEKHHAELLDGPVRWMI